MSHVNIKGCGSLHCAADTNDLKAKSLHINLSALIVSCEIQHTEATVIVNIYSVWLLLKSFISRKGRERKRRCQDCFVEGSFFTLHFPNSIITSSHCTINLFSALLLLTSLCVWLRAVWGHDSCRVTICSLSFSEALFSFHHLLNFIW